MRLEVYLNARGERRFVGLLEERGGDILFEYDKRFLDSGIELSPFLLPLRPGVASDPKRTFDGLFGVFNDSLPDGWGLLLLDRLLRRSGLPTDYESYENLHHIDPKTGEHVEMPPKPTAEERRAKKAESRAASKAAGAARAERLRRLINKNARSESAPDDKKNEKK